MAQDTTPALVLYVGDGSQTRFEVPFDKGAYGEIKVAFVRRGLTDYTYNPDTYTVDGYLYAWNGGVYTKTETVDTDTPLYDKNGEATGDNWTEGMYREPKNDIFTQAVVEWTGDALTTNDVICIVRNTVKDQPYTYPNNQKHIERALDNLARQIQELQLTADNALKVDPSWNYTMDDENKMDPITWLQTIVRSKDQTLRELRIDNGYVAYTADDPDSASKTWEVLAGVKTGNAGVVSHIRESKILSEDGVSYITFLEYSADGGDTWKPAGQAAAELDYWYVKKTGDTMSGTLGFQTTPSAPQLNIWQSGDTLVFAKRGGYYQVKMNLGTGSITPYSSGAGSVGTSAARWGMGYIDTLRVQKLWPYNGSELTVPAASAADTLALRSDIASAINSGQMITDQGFWYAKMDSATVAPSAEDGTNYADFSQVDGQGNPIIVTYNRVNGAWVQDQTITPPANADGYVLITSKIWDIPEQTGQQGGKILWNHTSQQFTPYPQIISFNDIVVTGDSTVVMPQNPGANQIVNKDYVDDAIAAIPTPTVDVTQSIDAEIVGSLTITDNSVVSGFSNNDYLQLPGVFDFGRASNSSFEIGGSFTTSENLGNHIVSGAISITIYSGNNPKLRVNVNDQSIMGTTALSDSTKYYMKVEYDGTDYKIWLSTDGTNYSLDVSAAATSSHSNNSWIRLGQGAAPTIQSIDLADWYIKKNGIMVWQGMGAPGLHQRAAKGHEVIAFQVPKVGNNYTWYRKYADGWVEQGGRVDVQSVPANTSQNISLPLTMADNKYAINLQEYTNSTNISNENANYIYSQTTTEFAWRHTSYGGNTQTMGVIWEVKGMAA